MSNESRHLQLIIDTETYHFRLSKRENTAIILKVMKMACKLMNI